MAILKTQKQEDLCELKAKLVSMISAKPDKIAKWASQKITMTIIILIILLFP